MGKRLKTAGPSLNRIAEVIVRSSQPMPKTCEVVGAWIHSMPRARPRRSATLPRLPPTEASCKATTSGRSAASCSTTISSRSFRSAPLPMSPDHGPPCRRLKVTTRTVSAWLWPTVIASRRLATTTDRQRIARLTGRTGSCTTREARRVGRDAQIGGQRDVQAGARGHAVDAANDGFLKPLHAKDAAVQALDERSPEIALEERRRALSTSLLIAAGRERPSGAGEDHRSHRGVGLELDEDALHLAHHRLVHGVQGLGPVEGEGHDAVVPVVQDGSVRHSRAP